MYIHYPSMMMLAGLHVLAFASLPYLYVTGVSPVELGYHVVAYAMGGFGITALYHRAWAHGAVKLARPIEYVLAAGSTFILQMPARQWISSHLRHHDHTDHDEDPYNIQRGFWWAHFEWIIFAPVPPLKLPARLEANPVIAWQERHYWHSFFVLNALVPVLIGWAVGSPWWGALLLSSLRLVIAMNVVFAVNSVCHVWGTRPFTKAVSARDVWWFPFALGEQYHNYHHAFPRDYRHGIRWSDFDPTKWLIWGLARIGLAEHLFAMPAARIAAAKVDAAKTAD